MKTGALLTTFCAASILVSTSLCPASELDDLKARVSALEERLTSLEKLLTPLTAKAEAEQRRDSQQLRAQTRMRQDAANFTQDQRREIESLYQVANQKWGTQAAQDSLRTLVEKYDKANRTGCAILYLGQMSGGDEKIRHLQKAIEQFDDCFYGDGVQVGAYARFLLGHAYLESDSPEKAKKLFNELRDKYPDAIDHRGNPLEPMLPE